MVQDPVYLHLKHTCSGIKGFHLVILQGYFLGLQTLGGSLLVSIAGCKDDQRCSISHRGERVAKVLQKGLFQETFIYLKQSPIWVPCTIMYQLYRVRSSLAKITVSGFVALPLLFSAWQCYKPSHEILSQSQWHPMAKLYLSCFFGVGVRWISWLYELTLQVQDEIFWWFQSQHSGHPFFAVSLHLDVCRPCQTPTCFRPRKDWTSYNLQLSFKFDSLREFFPKWILDPWYINDMYHILIYFISLFFLPSYFYIQSTPVQRLPLQKQNLLLGPSTVSSWWVSLRSWISTSWPCLTLSWACWNYSEPLDPWV